jgi:hypothetical protein
MDVSWSEAQRAETNVIARSDDPVFLLRKRQLLLAQRLGIVCATTSYRLRSRRAVVAAGDYVREKTPLRSVSSLTSIAPTPLDVHILNRRVVDDRTHHGTFLQVFSNPSRPYSA